MKHLLIIFSLSFLMLSCGEKTVEKQDNAEDPVKTVEQKDPVQEAKDLKELQELDVQLVKNDLTIDLNVAKELYTRAIAFSKDYPNSDNLETVLSYAAKGAEDLGNYTEAVEILHKMANDIPESNKTAVYMYNKGKILEEKMNKKDAAKAAYKDLIKRFPRNPLSKSMKSYLSKGMIDMTKEEKIKYLQELNQD
jgi:TolA-binding protein